MTKMTVGGGLVISMAMALWGCNIETCEHGAVCDQRDDPPPEIDDGKGNGPSQTEQCLNYCERLNICGAPQAKDFDACVKDCKVRFDRLPEQTAERCSCIPKSRCEDVIEGRCSHDAGSGGTSGGSAAGGASSKGGSRSSGGAAASGGSHVSGSSPATGGTSGLGGSPSEGGASCGGSAGTTGGSSGASGGSAGAGGETPGDACTCDCNCPAAQTCVNGFCAG